MGRSISPAILLSSLLVVALILFTDPAMGQTSVESSDVKFIDTINARLGSSWEEHGLRPASPAPEAEWCRRVYLDLIGHLPSVKELDAFTAKPARSKQQIQAKRAALVDRLLGSEYAADYVNHWSAMWSNTLIGRTGGQMRRSLTSRDGMRDYLSDALLANKHYDKLAEELITATGSATPGEEDFNGAVNFLIEKLADDGVQATAKTAEIFLGTAVQCTQCHNHPFNESRQNQFWELNAFFRQTAVDVEREMDTPERLGRIVNRDFAGEGRELYGDNRREIYLEDHDGKLIDRDAAREVSAPIYYELRNGQMQVAYPAFIDGTRLVDLYSERNPDGETERGNSGYLEDVDRRRELVELVTQAREFDQAIVNRMWAYFFGYGFTRPFHDMGPHNPASHPELLDELGLAFRKSGFDLKRLMRWLVLSDAYGLSSRESSGNQADDPTKGVVPQFSRFYVRQMLPEQLFESLLVATAADATVAKAERADLKDRWLRQFDTSFGTDDNAEATTFNGSIPQVLTLMNGDLIRRACSTNSGSFLARIANDKSLSNREKINYLYRAALGRQPTKPEANLCNELLAARNDDVVGTLEDVWWAVLNSNEFILVH
ncbi:MAG: DUF1549 domain-containing protein [Bythopirellula sp.]|nr:DUF1549 domain-containing protein [Bythopirellula sp.]